MLIVTHEHLTLYRNDEHLRRSAGAVCKWDLDDIPRFRLQKLNQLNDSEKIFIVNLARYKRYLSVILDCSCSSQFEIF